jgi:hypothetical protein
MTSSLREPPRVREMPIAVCEAQANEQRYGEQKCEDYKIFGRAYSTSA